jgi:hypothetical protein
MARLRFIPARGFPYSLFFFAAALVYGLTPLSARDATLGLHVFTLPEDFEIELVAGPSLVDRPIVADFDEQGRLYVADSSGSNEPTKVQLEKKPHRIVRLSDSDGDGKFDRSTVFADAMMFPEGALWHDGSLYVGAPPTIWKLTDTDDDGIADKRDEWFQAKTSWAVPWARWLDLLGKRCVCGPNPSTART